MNQIPKFEDAFIRDIERLSKQASSDNDLFGSDEQYVGGNRYDFLFDDEPVEHAVESVREIKAKSNNKVVEKVAVKVKVGSQPKLKVTAEYLFGDGGGDTCDYSEEMDKTGRFLKDYMGGSFGDDSGNQNDGERSVRADNSSGDVYDEFADAWTMEKGYKISDIINDPEVNMRKEGGYSGQTSGGRGGSAITREGGESISSGGGSYGGGGGSYDREPIRADNREYNNTVDRDYSDDRFVDQSQLHDGDDVIGDSGSRFTFKTSNNSNKGYRYFPGYEETRNNFGSIAVGSSGGAIPVNNSNAPVSAPVTVVKSNTQLNRSSMFKNIVDPE